MTENIKIYYIVHYDNLRSIVDDGFLLTGRRVVERGWPSTDIGMSNIKQRRTALPLRSRPGLQVGACVPFYFCPRSVMLYVIYKRNHQDLGYQGGQNPIVHLEADLNRTVMWAEQHRLRWAFTTSNAATKYFDDYADLELLCHVDWKAVDASNWRDCKSKKQAEFLVETRFPWSLVERIGFRTQATGVAAWNAVQDAEHHPEFVLKPTWYY